MRERNRRLHRPFPKERRADLFMAKGGLEDMATQDLRRAGLGEQVVHICVGGFLWPAQPASNVPRVVREPFLAPEYGHELHPEGPVGLHGTPKDTARRAIDRELFRP